MVYDIDIGKKPFKVVPVNSTKALEVGLSSLDRLGRDKGMLFIFGKRARPITMNMRDMSFPIDMLFLDEYMVVQKVATMKPGEETITVPNTSYVLEVNAGEGAGLKGKKLSVPDDLKASMIDKGPEETSMVIGTNEQLASEYKEGGVIEIIEKDVKADTSKMQVLDDKGVILMNIQGGERIFSIKHTAELVAMAKKVENGEATEEDLGELMAKIIKIHDTQKPQYTKN